jgi:tetratricopeptide (TPR) repeat protein
VNRAIVLALALATVLPAHAQRMASDFEIARIREEIASSKDFVTQLSARLNLGDLYLTRSDRSTAISEYQQAFELADKERTRARAGSDMTGYATATAYAALAQAKLRRGPQSFALLEEALRFASDSAKTWNIYATAMTLQGRPEKGVSAARNAVAIAAAEFRRSPSIAARLDLAIYQHALAAALIEIDHDREGESLLREVVASLQSRAFASVRRDVERSESFEIFSSARGDVAAYLSLLNRAQLRLAALEEERGDLAAARASYRRVLDQRSDDPTALAAFARLAPADEQARWFAAAFDANPFSISLIRAYQGYLAAHGAPRIDGTATGATMRLALHQMAAGETRAARTTLDELLAQFPTNDALRLLRVEADSSRGLPDLIAAGAETIEARGSMLRQLIASNDRLTPEERRALDAATFRGVALFRSALQGAPGQTIFESGTIDGVAFRFAEPTAFYGAFTTGAPLRLTFRVLGVTAVDGRDALLLEPLGIEASR